MDDLRKLNAALIEAQEKGARMKRVSLKGILLRNLALLRIQYRVGKTENVTPILIQSKKSLPFLEFQLIICLVLQA